MTMKTTCENMDTIHEENIQVQQLPSWLPNLTVDVLRLDLIHPIISGNKWFKLKYNLQQITDLGFKQVLTFGGPYSNHLVATAAAAKYFGISSVGIVRGEFDETQLSPTMQACKEFGMQLIFVSRADYSKKNESAFLNQLQTQYPNAFIIPEGGANEWGRKGCVEINKYISDSYTHICCSIGSGTTFTGLCNAAADHQQLIGFVPMKQGNYLTKDISDWVNKKKTSNWQLTDEFHFGGFGKYNQELLNFMNTMYFQFRLPLDFVYTAKMMMGVKVLSERDFFPAQSRIICIHSGGLQGNNSIQSYIDF